MIDMRPIYRYFISSFLTCIILINIGCDPIDVKLLISKSPFNTGLPADTSYLDIFAVFDHTFQVTPPQNVSLLENPAPGSGIYSVGLILDDQDAPRAPQSGLNVYVGAVRGSDRCLISYGASQTLLPPFTTTDLQVELSGVPSGSAAQPGCSQSFPHLFSVSRVDTRDGSGVRGQFTIGGWGFSSRAAVTAVVKNPMSGGCMVPSAASHPRFTVSWVGFQTLVAAVDPTSLPLSSETGFARILEGCKVDITVQNPPGFGEVTHEFQF